MGRSLQHSIVKWFRTLQGRNPKGAPRIPPLPIHQLTSYHFYPVAGAAGMRRAYTATENQYHLNIGVKFPLVKVLEILKNFF